jgi:hypothetical protein
MFFDTPLYLTSADSGWTLNQVKPSDINVSTKAVYFKLHFKSAAKLLLSSLLLLLLLLLHTLFFNPLAPSDPYMGHTAQLTSRRLLLNTYSTNIHTECFKRAA